MNVRIGVYAINENETTIMTITADIKNTKKLTLVKRMTHNCLWVMSSTSDILKCSTFGPFACLAMISTNIINFAQIWTE